MKRLLSWTTNSLIGAAMLLAGASLVSRLVGLLRDRLLAHLFGAGDMLDAYYAAFRIPDTIYNLLIAGALSAGFIPVFIKLWGKDKERAWKFVNNAITICGIALVTISGILWLLTPYVMSLIVPGFAPEKLQTTILLTRIMFLSPIILGLSATFSSVLQSLRSFFIYALTPIMYNIGIIIGAWFLVPRFGAVGLAYGVILGASLHLAIQLPALYQHGFRYQPILNVNDSDVRDVIHLMIPRTLGLAANQVNLLAVTILASSLPAGSIAIFNFANNLQFVPVGIIGISFAVAAFPTLSERAAEQDIDGLRQHFSTTVRQILFFILPTSMIFLLLRAQIVRVTLGSGAFDWTATIITANALAFFAISLFAQSLTALLARTFYALHDTWTAFHVSIVCELMSLILSLSFRDRFGVVGFALAFSIASIVQVTLLWVILRKKLTHLFESATLHSLYKLSLATIAMALTIQALKTPLANLVDMTKFWGILTQGTLAGTAGLILYGCVCYVLRVEEMLNLKSSFTRRWMKLWGIPGEIQDSL